MTVSTATTGNTITVTRTGGTETGTSNAFDVTSTTVDHFTIAAITSPQTAGTPFNITITAEDASNNTVTGFTGTVNLSDLTGTISPTLTSNFSGGVLSNFSVTITKSMTANVITATGVGKSGASNSFDVDAAALDHFAFSDIPSPQVAGTPFSLTITALDTFENTVESFTDSLTLSDVTGTISPARFGPFTNGQLTGNVTITRKTVGDKITATFNAVTSSSSVFNVDPGALDHLLIRDAAGGLGVEVGDRGLTLDERLTLYAAGYDVFGNYIREVTATWDTTGTLDLPSPLIGTSTTFDPIKPSSGMITADTADVNVQGDSTGLITVGSIAKIIIRDAANGLGNVVSDRQITADDSLSLFAAGYDAGNQFIGDVAVDWFSGGNLTPAINQLVVSSVTFRPTLAPASGKIFADHVTAADDSTGTITVVPGIPVGTVTLTPVPAALAADGTSQSTITSATIVDGDSNAVGVNTLFLVTLSDNNLGTIVTPDADPGTPGHQIATNASSQLSFEFKAGTTGGTVIISVFSGNASGNTAIAIGSMAIESIETDPTTVSQGQRNIEVRLVVDNLSISTITNLDASLSFANAGAVDRTGQYSQVRTDPFTDIPGGGKRTLTFDVTVQPSASLETITIDGTVNGKIGAADVSAQGALTTDSWAVQSVAELKAVSVTSSETLVTVGQPGIGVSVVVQNNPGFTTTATALIDSLKLRFLKDGSVDKSSDFPFQPDVGNPDSITGGDQATFNFTVTVGSTADTGHYEIDVQVFGRDANSDSSISDLNADSRHAWTVQGAPTLQILSLTPTPKSTFFANQTDDWTVKMAVKNNGPDPIDIDFSPANTFIKFIIGSDRTPQYTIVYPTSLAGGGIRLNSGARDTLNFVIDVTGATIGTATITGRVQGTDVGTSNTIFDDTNDSGTGVVNIISPNRTIFIAQTNPETSNSSQGIGIVDTSQAFKISVNVKNDLGEAVENVVVQLTSNGFSTVVVNPDTIPVIASGASVTKMFDVIASSTRNSAETFTAQILGGTGQQSGAQAQIGSSLDDNAIVKVQTPALLRVDFTQIDPFQTASDTFTVRARVTNSGEAQVDDTGLLRLIQDSKYSFVGTNSIQAFSEGQTIEWQLKAPDTATVADTFVVQIFQVPKEKNTLLSAATEALTDTAVIQTLDIDLFIQNWRVANPPGATDNILSTKQRFDLEATLSVSENIDSVRTDLDLSAANGYSLTPTFQSSVFLDNPNDQERILWTVEATNLPHASPFPIGVRVRGWDKGSLVTDTRDTVAVVAVARAFIDIDNFKISNPNNATQVSIGQAFELSALVLNTGVAQVEGPAVLRLDLGNSGFETSDSLRQTFVPGTAVTWDLTVPAAATIGGKTISVMLDSIPDDENTNNTAEHDPQQLTKTLNVEIIDVGTIAIDTLRITAPAGATDGVLSADQQFTVEAEVQFSRARNIQAEIVFPAGSGFRVIGGGGNRFQDITSQGPEATVQWTVQAPVNPFSGLIKVKVTGTDASNPNQTISADPDSMLTTVVNKAQLTFNAFISSPPSAQDKELSFGQVFTVTAQLQNSGAGLSGLDSVKITLPAPYTTNDPLVKSIAPFPGGQATWIITAPNQTTPILDIVVELQPLSLDENTNQPPTVNATDVIISVTTAPIGLRTTLLTDRKKGTAVRGAKNVSIFGLQFDNDSDLIINIEKVNLSVQNSAGDSLAPNAFLSGLSVVDYLNSNTVFGPAPVLTAADRIELSFSPAIMVPPNQNISIDFQVDLLDQSEVSAFQFVLDSPQDEIMAIDADGNRVGIEDGTGNPISSLTSGVSVLINADLQSSFFNYPNPFGYSTRKQTFFSYNLAQDSDITIRVYTLLGEMVWSRSFAATDPQGKAGNHDKDIMWEGKNDKGQKVLNGVYVAVLSTNSGKATTKIAITR
ncbi:MAG: T9SS type A sorting domain-containing protein [bacterium]